jgi:hypothetical protein
MTEAVLRSPSPSSAPFSAASYSSSSSTSPPIQSLLANNAFYLEKFNAYICPYNNYYNYTNYELDLILTYKHYINGWLSFAIILFGILANSVTVCALLHKYLRSSSTNAYLLALSASNLMSLVCMFLMTALRFTLVHPYRLHYCKHWYENLINQLIPFLTPVNNLFQLSGIYLIIAVSIDRLVIIRIHGRPTEQGRRRRLIATWCIISAIFLFCILFTLPNWFLYRTTVTEMSVNKSELLRGILNNYEKFSAAGGDGGMSSGELGELVEGYNRTVKDDFVYKLKHVSVDHTSFGQKKLIKSVISVYMYIPFVFFIPISVLLIVNFLIIYELVKISKRYVVFILCPSINLFFCIQQKIPPFYYFRLGKKREKNSVKIRFFYGIPFRGSVSPFRSLGRTEISWQL